MCVLLEDPHWSRALGAASLALHVISETSLTECRAIYRFVLYTLWTDALKSLESSESIFDRQCCWCWLTFLLSWAFSLTLTMTCGGPSTFLKATRSEVSEIERHAIVLMHSEPTGPSWPSSWYWGSAARIAAARSQMVVFWLSHDLSFKHIAIYLHQQDKLLFFIYSVRWDLRGIMAFIGGVLDCASFGFLLTSGFGGSCAHNFRCLRYFGNSFWTLHLFSFLGSWYEAGMKLVWSWLKDVSIAVETFGKARHVDAGTSGLQDIQATVSTDERHPFRHVRHDETCVITCVSKWSLKWSLSTRNCSYHSYQLFLILPGRSEEMNKCPSWHLSPDKWYGSKTTDAISLYSTDALCQNRSPSSLGRIHHPFGFSSLLT